MYEIMKIYFKILKLLMRGIPPKRISVICNELKLTIPRRLNFSGHFHLNTALFLGGWLKVAVRN